MRIYPAIDIYDGKCVRLHQGRFDDRTTYSDSPGIVAKGFLDAGFPFLHVVDLEGARNGRITNWDSLGSILQIPGVQVQVGGGIRSEGDIESLLTMGARRVIIGSVAITKRVSVKKWIQHFGPDRMAIAVDVRNETLAHGGWLKKSGLSPIDFITGMIEAGASSFICTDISRDGMLQGPNIAFYADIRSRLSSIELIASGGVSSYRDVQILAEVGVSGVVIGKALYENGVDLEGLKSLDTR